MMEWISAYLVDITGIPGGVKVNFSYTAIVLLIVISFVGFRHLLKRMTA